MIDFCKKHFLTIVIIIALGLFTYFTIAHRAAINMDEFSQYHPVLCTYYPNNKLNIFREGCTAYYLITPIINKALPWRAYDYGGSLASWYLYPLFAIWQSPEAPRMLGFAFILLQAWVLSKIIRQRFRNVLIGLVLFFPYVYQVVVDTGLVHFYTTAVLFLVYFMERWFATQKSRYIMAVGFGLFLLIWSRLSFVYGIPALVLVFIAFGVHYFPVWRSHWKQMLSGALVSLVIMAVPTALYILGTSPFVSGQMPIIAELTKRSTHGAGGILDPDTYLSSQLFWRFANPLEASSRAYNMPPVGSLDLFYSLLLFLGPVFLFVRKKVNRKALLFYVAFLVTFIFLFRFTDAIHTHHAMMAYPFLILSWGYLIPEIRRLFGKWFPVAVASFLVFNLYYFVSYTNNPTLPEQDSSEVTVNTILKSDYLGKNYFYAVSNWGIYFYQGMFGPKEQSVLYIQGYLTDNTIMGKLDNYPEKYNRKFLFVYNKLDPTTKSELLKFKPGLQECSQTKATAVWGILMAPDADQQNPCR